MVSRRIFSAVKMWRKAGSYVENHVENLSNMSGIMWERPNNDNVLVKNNTPAHAYPKLIRGSINDCKQIIGLSDAVYDG